MTTPQSKPAAQTLTLDAPAPGLLDDLLTRPAGTSARMANRAELLPALDAALAAAESLRAGRSIGATTCTTPLAAQSAAASWQALFGSLSNVTARDACRKLEAAAAQIEAAIGKQVNAILHQPRFQRLEASWRGLNYLWQQARDETERAEEMGERIEIRVRLLCVTKKELRNDAADAADFDQSVLFKKVYEAEFGQAGGEPFGLLVGDYEFRNHPDDIDLLRSLSSVAAAAFAPFVAAAAPQFFGLSDFRRLEVGLPLEQDFQRPDFIPWRSLRESDDARFIGLTMPRVLMRGPYRLDPLRGDAFRFKEDVAEESGHSKYLWGNAAFALASVVMRAYVETGWFADIRGFERGHDSGGLVTGLASDYFDTDREGLALKTPTDVALAGDEEQTLAELGFIPLCACPGTRHSAFYSNASVHKPQKLSDPAANTTAKMSAMLQYVLCASRFAHYLKNLGRTQLGSFNEAETLTSKLRNWIADYVADDPQASPEIKARYPLREAEINVEEMPGRPGAYRMVMRLLPHYQLDALSATLKLVHRLPNTTV